MAALTRDCGSLRDRFGPRAIVATEAYVEDLLTRVVDQRTIDEAAEVNKLTASAYADAGERFVVGVVLHTGSRVYALGERIMAAPIAALWA